MKEFEKLLGNRIYLEIPDKKENKLIVDENTKEALEKEMLKKQRRLKVYSVGDIITNIKEGDEVLVEPSSLKNAPLIPLTDEKNVLLVSYFDVIHIW